MTARGYRSLPAPRPLEIFSQLVSEKLLRWKMCGPWNQADPAPSTVHPGIRFFSKHLLNNNYRSGSVLGPSHFMPASKSFNPRVFIFIQKACWEECKTTA